MAVSIYLDMAVKVVLEQAHCFKILPQIFHHLAEHIGNQVFSPEGER